MMITDHQIKPKLEVTETKTSRDRMRDVGEKDHCHGRQGVLSSSEANVAPQKCWVNSFSLKVWSRFGSRDVLAATYWPRSAKRKVRVFLLFPRTLSTARVP